jgi:2-phospho-L-lactate transferase/gluconeogenesis factor (CofD/UPF0052 family)
MNTVEHSTGLAIVEFAGGGGGSVLTPALAGGFPESHISVVVPTGDGGGNTELLRRVLGGPAVGDCRKILGSVAQNGSAELFQDRKDGNPFGRFGAETTIDHVEYLNDLFWTAIDKEGVNTALAGKILDETVELAGDFGSLEGHNYMNLVVSALRLEMGGSLTQAMDVMSRWVDAPRHVEILPVTEESHNVVMHDKAAGVVLVGEGVVDAHTPQDVDAVDVWLETGAIEKRIINDPQAVAEYLERRQTAQAPVATPRVMGAIAISKLGILAPGSPYTSQIPVMTPTGVREASLIQRAAGGFRVAVTNLTQEKPGMTIGKHLRTVQNASGVPVTHFVHNISKDGLPEGEVPLRFDPEADGFLLETARHIPAALVGAGVAKDPNDKVAHLRSSTHTNGWAVVQVLRDDILPQYAAAA